MDSLQEFQNLLKKLFQFETSDLNFGIYRLSYLNEQSFSDGRLKYENVILNSAWWEIKNMNTKTINKNINN